MLAKGERAPLFVAPGTEGEVDLQALLDRGPATVYFFPRAMSGG